jgi:hypothetical protein
MKSIHIVFLARKYFIIENLEYTSLSDKQILYNKNVIFNSFEFSLIFDN